MGSSGGAKWLVVAGMGEEEPFPAVVQYCVGTVAAGD